jgi:hypothetical protein
LSAQLAPPALFPTLKVNYSSIQVEESWEFLDSGDAVSWLSVEDIAGELKFFEIGELAEFLDIVKLSDFVGVGKQVLEAEELLDVHEVLEAVVVDFEAFDG